MSDTSLADLKRRIVSSAPAAARIGDAMRLLPLILLREDPRVRRAYEEWLARTSLNDGAAFDVDFDREHVSNLFTSVDAGGPRRSQG